ncbi:type II secretion system F family protein [Klebsiella sp. PL-2018]|uniref:type II secretion system F family protein n=1 Tax=Klebsiella TaxID=570 RepID=UPI001C24D739|nr:type II secretion system F family protein [Klebsiella sp. PL-2018]QXD00969.1 IncI1 plasmid conjugative transfer inner membrane protein PilR [Klebsiella sp. PL-2018]
MTIRVFLLRLRRSIVRRTFSGEYRTRFYDALRFMLDNNISLRDALDKMRNAWTDFGQKWHPFAELTDDLTDALRENAGDNTLDATLGRWLPADEAAVLSAGIHGGDLPGALQFATELTGARKRIMAAVAQMSIYPLGLVIMLSGTLFVVNTKLIPVLSRMSAPDTWDGAIGFIWHLSAFLDTWGVACAAAIVCLVVMIALSVPRLTHPVAFRKALDQWLPWSLYRDIQGAAFLLNLAALMKAGVGAGDALLLLDRTASPWLSQRLLAAHAALREGAGPGQALRDCGMDFPSREAVNFLSLLDGDGATDIVANYGRRWLEQSLDNINQRAVRLRLVMLFALLGSLGLLVLIVTEVQNMGSAAGLS